MSAGKRTVAAFVAAVFLIGCKGERMTYFEGARPRSDAGTNTFSPDLSGIGHWRGADKGSNPRVNPNTDSTPFKAASLTGKMERWHLEAKPQSVDECTKVTIFVIQRTSDTFDPASGFMEFPIKLYKGDGVTLLGTSAAHIPPDHDPSTSPAGDDLFNFQSYEFPGLTLNQADIDAGLVVEFDSSAPDGWVGGGTWTIYAVWAGFDYTLSEEHVQLVECFAPIRTIEVFAPITTCVVESPVGVTVDVAAKIDPN